MIDANEATPTIKTLPTIDDKVSIIIVHRDRPAYLNLLLQSITVTSLNNNYEVVVVDNGSESQDSKTLLDELEKQDCTVVRCKENLWWSKAANLGAKAADKASKYFIFMHHDVVVLMHGWIDYMVNASEAEDSGLIGVNMSKMEMQEPSGRVIEIDYIDEWCMLTTRDCWEDCGPFEEKLEQTGSQFLYSLKANFLNYHPHILQNHLVSHYNVFALDVSEFEQLRDKAYAQLPTLILAAQSKARKE